ncbi:hypothetical protein NQZ68_003877 [Dissostichus eleginoides]|nr:hypothetical protein NQZ68_003877 [Dissostichus eleginoides]
MVLRGVGRENVQNRSPKPVMHVSQERPNRARWKQATQRVKLKEGVTFLGARPSNPTQWMVSQDVRSEGHRVVTLHCRRKESGYDQQRK